MLSKDDLKKWLQQLTSHKDRLLLLLAYADRPLSVDAMRELARDNGLKLDKGWNPSTSLRRASSMAIRLPSGWEITDVGRQHLISLGVQSSHGPSAKLASDLRVVLSKVTDPQTRTFMEEAIKCHEYGLGRAAVVTSWLGAIYVLQLHVVAHALKTFNTEALRCDPKWKTAATADDLGRMKESDFLDRLSSISVIGKNTKTELKQCLDLRNACGHPSSLVIGQNTVARHLEILLLNVFHRF